MPRWTLSTSERAATSPLKGRLVMEKAHLYEALYLVNQGIDEAVRGVSAPEEISQTLHGGLPQVHGWARTPSFHHQPAFMLEMRKLEEDR